MCVWVGVYAVRGATLSSVHPVPGVVMSSVQKLEICKHCLFSSLPGAQGAAGRKCQTSTVIFMLKQTRLKIIYGEKEISLWVLLQYLALFAQRLADAFIQGGRIRSKYMHIQAAEG